MVQTGKYTACEFGVLTNISGYSFYTYQTLAIFDHGKIATSTRLLRRVSSAG
jgi:hypothetical protein